VTLEDLAVRIDALTAQLTRPSEPPPLTVTLQQAADMLGVSRSHLQEMVKAGTCPLQPIAPPLGQSARYRRADVEKWGNGKWFDSRFFSSHKRRA
jgi:excisionase family DNA binding protein